MRSIRILTLCALALGLFAAPGLAADAGGVWKGEVTLPTGQVLPFVVRLTQNGSAITGTLDGIGGAPDVEIVNGKIDKDVITFSGVRQINNMPVTFNYTAMFADNDTLDFTILRDDGEGAPLGSVTKRSKE